MAKVVSVHSFRRGTGKTNLVASVAAIMASEGQRIGIVDTNIQSPSAHILFGINDDQIRYFLNDYIMGACKIEQAAIDVTEHLDIAPPGQLFLVPSDPAPVSIAKVLRGGVNTAMLHRGYRQLIQELVLDILLLDTCAGIHEQNMASLATSEVAIIIFRLDHQDYQGTAVLLDLACTLGVREVMLVINNVSSAHEPARVKAEVEETYSVEVASLIPYSEDLSALGSNGVFAACYPEHPLTKVFKDLAARLLS